MVEGFERCGLTATRTAMPSEVVVNSMAFESKVELQFKTPPRYTREATVVVA